MSRLLAIFLALVLPMQFAWAAAATYCPHEPPSVKAAHFGHHEHEHKSDVQPAVDGKVALDDDCGICHAVGTPAVVPSSAHGVGVVHVTEVRDTPSQSYISAQPRPPDRPQWFRLA